MSGLAGLRYDPEDESRNDVYLRDAAPRAPKGRPGDVVPIGAKTAAAIDKYIRAKARHSQAASGWLWLGTRGTGVSHMTDSGIRAMLKRRGREAGVQGVHPHRFRHTFADRGSPLAAT